MNAGARPQRVLWAGTGTKDPAASDTLYVGSLVAPYTVNTLPAKTLLAFAEHGTFSAILGHDLEAAEATIDFHARSGIDLVLLAAKLQEDGVAAFTRSWHDTLEFLSRKGGSATSPR
jgi:transaldolase